MGVHWGSAWFQVKHETIALNGVILLSAYPDGSGEWLRGLEVTKFFLPNLSGFTFIKHPNKSKAMTACKQHLMQMTGDMLIDNADALIRLKVSLENRRSQSRNEVFSDPELDLMKVQLASFKDTDKSLSKLRRTKVREFVESELIALDVRFNLAYQVR